MKAEAPHTPSSSTRPSRALQRSLVTLASLVAIGAVACFSNLAPIETRDFDVAARRGLVGGTKLSPRPPKSEPQSLSFRDGRMLKQRPQTTALARSLTAQKGIPLTRGLRTSSGPLPAKLAGPPRKEAKPENQNFEETEDASGERYQPIADQPFVKASGEHRRSTFGVDVDTAAYANVRRFLGYGQKPPRDAVRIEELVNYFSYEDPAPQGEVPFAAQVEVAPCAWNVEHRLVRIGLKGRAIDLSARPASNLVLLLDVSGSMSQPNKLPLLKRSLMLMLEELGENDRVAIVVYAGASGLALDSTSCDRAGDIAAALDRLQAGGSTNGGAGIELAYRVAEQNFIPGGTNRVLLCTDGDFNVGAQSRATLLDLIATKAKSKVFLTVLGFGMGNIRDDLLEGIADRGNGAYHFIDGLGEAKKVLVEQLGGTLVTIAKDVKIQVEFGPRVASYRLIGYENRRLANKDFANDAKDAGDIGAGHSVVALYEVELKQLIAEGVEREPLLELRLRYKKPEEDHSELLSVPVFDQGQRLAEATDDFKFSSAVAAVGQIIRGSPYKGSASLELVRELADAGRGPDRGEHREAFLKLVDQARGLFD